MHSSGSHCDKLISSQGKENPHNIKVKLLTSDFQAADQSGLTSEAAKSWGQKRGKLQES